MLAAVVNAAVLSLSLSTLDRALFSANREAEGLLRRLRQSQVGEDNLARLNSVDRVLPAGSACVVTGASDGLGREAAKALALYGHPVILCVRDLAKGEDAAAYISTAPGSAPVKVVSLDLSSYASVAAGVEAIGSAAEELDAPLRGLLLNAGMWPVRREPSVDGLELGFHTNHVGHMQLATGLLPLLRDGLGPDEEARVVSVASSAHAFADGIALDAKPQAGWAARPWDASEAYGEGKLANVLFARELSERQLAYERSSPSPCGRLTCLSCHPGVVATNLFRDFSELPPDLPGPAAGALAAVSAAAEPAREALRVILYTLYLILYTLYCYTLYLRERHSAALCRAPTTFRASSSSRRSSCCSRARRRGRAPPSTRCSPPTYRRAPTSPTRR